MKDLLAQERRRRPRRARSVVVARSLGPSARTDGPNGQHTCPAISRFLLCQLRTYTGRPRRPIWHGTLVAIRER